MPHLVQPRTINLGDLRAIAARSRGLRGLGDGSVPACLSGSGPLQPGQAYCDTADVAATVGPYCFSPLFPWLGNQISGGGSPTVCSPVFNVPSPWNAVITAGVAGLFLFKLFGGRR